MIYIWENDFNGQSLGGISLDFGQIGPSFFPVSVPPSTARQIVWFEFFEG